VLSAYLITDATVLLCRRVCESLIPSFRGGLAGLLEVALDVLHADFGVATSGLPVRCPTSRSLLSPKWMVIVRPGCTPPSPNTVA
jgi:hypothetical protein